MADEATAGWGASGQGRRRFRLPWWVWATGAVLGTLGAVLLVFFLQDLYWTHLVYAKVKDLKAAGQLITADELVNQWRSIPEEGNASLVFLKAFAAHKDVPAVEAVRSLVPATSPGSRPSPQTLSLVRQDVDANAEALDLIYAGAALPQGCYPLDPPPEGDFWAVLLPHLEKMRRAALLCAGSALLAANAGDGAQAGKDVRAALALGASIGDRTFWVCQMVRAAADAIAIGALEQSLSLCEVPESSLDAVTPPLAREMNGFSMVWPLVAERSAGQFTIAVEVPRGWFTFPGESAPNRWYMHWPGWRQRDALYFHRSMDWYSAVAQLPARDELRALKAGNSQLGGEFDNPRRPCVLSYILLDGYPKMMQRSIQARTYAAVARTAVAVEKWRLEHGRWPDSLQQTVGDTLDAVPQDPYGDGTLVYRKTDTGCIVYSIGPDDKDQGGLSEAEAMPKLRAAYDAWSKGDFLWAIPDVHGIPPPPPLDAYDLPFRLLNPELRGAKTMSFREEVLGAKVQLKDLESAGLDEAALKRLGLTDEDLMHLK